MQKRNLLYLSILAAVIFCFSYAQAALQFLPRYQGSYGTRNQEGGRDKVEVTCKTYGGVEKETNQTCTGQFSAGGKTCYKSCSCNKSKFQYTIASHQGSGKLCESLSNACTDSAGTSYSNCVLNTCNVRNSTWISESSKASYTSNNYTCTSQNTSGKDGTCYVCACPSSWATGSCPANSATCSTCKAISPYTVSKFNLVSCKAGYYKNGNSCTQCPKGSYCDGINKTLCPAGSYSAAGASSCSQCQAGTYSAAGASSCSQCQAGTYSTKGSSKCLDCSAGTYSNAGAGSCTSCAAGKYSSAKASYCNTCAAGTYSAAGASSCTNCAAGKYSAAGASSCSTCAAGTYSSAGASSCTKCAAGKYSAAGASSCSTCAAGTYSAAGASSCTNCAAGKYSKAGSSSCSSCSGNTYSAAGAGSCTSCSSGSVANSTHTDCLNDTCASGYSKTACAENQIQTGTTTTAAGSTCYACQTKALTCAEWVKENHSDYTVYTGGGYISAGKVAVLASGTASISQSGTIEFVGPKFFDYEGCKNQETPVLTISNTTQAFISAYNIDIEFDISSMEDPGCSSRFEYCKNYATGTANGSDPSSGFSSCMGTNYGTCNYYDRDTSCCNKIASILPPDGTKNTMLIKDASISSNAAVFKIGKNHTLKFQGKSSVSTSCEHKTSYGCRSIFAGGDSSRSVNVIFDVNSSTVVNGTVYMFYSSLMQVSHGARVVIQGGRETGLFVNQNGYTPTYYGDQGVHNYGTIITDKIGFHAGQLNNYSGSAFSTGSVGVSSSSWPGRITHTANSKIKIGSVCKLTNSQSEYKFTANTSNNPFSGSSCTIQ